MGMRKKWSLVFILVGLLVLTVNFPLQARENYRSFYSKSETRSMSIQEIESSKETCVQCHTRTTPRVVAEFQSGAHSKVGVDCASCHGSDHSAMRIVTGKKSCQKCHQQETKDMLASKHSSSWYNAWKNPRYEVLPKSMRQQGCARCHDISYGMLDVSDVRCDYCHKSHDFSLEEARSPLSCSTCHMGPDHPQAEAYESSAHGKLYFQGKNALGTAKSAKGLPGGTAAPTCITCHQSEGTHNVSHNVGLGGVSNGGIMDTWKWFLDEAGKPVMKRSVLTQEKFQQVREGNLLTCSKCHDKATAAKALAKADNYKMTADKQLLEARQEVLDLDNAGLIYPKPVSPMEGNTLVLGGNQLYSDISKAEAIYFRMFKFAGTSGWKSAYHQDFSRADAEGDKELVRLRGELKDEATVLRMLGDVTAARESAEKQQKTDITRGYITLAVAGIILGVVLALAALRFRKVKGKVLTGIFLLSVIILIAGIFPKQALAWDPANSGQKCSACHAKQADQLKTGKHSSLQCLNCHQSGKGLDQVRKPETCGKCHKGSSGYQLETYMSSPHGVKYRVKGLGEWVPTCATCHMSGGAHNPIGLRAPKQDFLESPMGKVCLKCHTTDEMLKFGQDIDEIYKTTDEQEAALKQAGLDLISRGMLISEDEGASLEEQKARWGKDRKWKLVNQEKLTGKEQDMVKKLIDQLVMKTQDGLNEAAPKTRIGTAHVNPDYAHWYGNAFLSLDLAEARGTAKELETFAYRTGYVGNNKTIFDWRGLVIITLTITAGFAITCLLLRRSKKLE